MKKPARKSTTTARRVDSSSSSKKRPATAVAKRNATKKLTGSVTRTKAADLAVCYGAYLQATTACFLGNPPTVDEYKTAGMRAEALIVAQKSAGIQLCKLSELRFVIKGAKAQVRSFEANRAKQEAIDADAKAAAERAKSKELSDMFEAASIEQRRIEAALTPLRSTTWDRIETPVNKTAALGVSHRKTEI